MKMIKSQACALATCAAMVLAATRGADTQPATPPATRPANIEKIVKIAPITLKTNGVMPNEAFSMLTKATGVEFTEAESVLRGGAGPGQPINLWGDRTYAKIDFDLEGATFWQAVDRVAAKADIRIEFENRLLTLYPGPSFIEPAFNDSPLVRASVAAVKGSHSEQRINGEITKVTDIPAGLQLNLLIDPRVTLCRWGAPVMEEARDEKGNDLPFRAVNPDDPQWDPWKLTYILAPQAAGAKILQTFRGYVPVTAVTGTKVVVLPLTIGSKVTAGRWVIELVDVERVGGNRPWADVFLSIEKKDISSPAVPADLRTLVHALDETGEPLIPDSSRSPEPRATVTGGIREHILFLGATMPDKVVVDVPTETKEAALPFEFNDVRLP